MERRGGAKFYSKQGTRLDWWIDQSTHSSVDTVPIAFDKRWEEGPGDPTNLTQLWVQEADRAAS